MTAKATKPRTAKPATPAKKARPPRASTPAGKGKSKLDAIIAALRTSKGATQAQLMALTGWQMHSVRGAMSGALKKQRGISIVSTKPGSERIYRIENRK